MKSLKEHITEGLLDDIETTLKNSDKNNLKVIKAGVIEFLKENYSGRYKISAKPNSDGKFEVSANINDIELKNRNAKSLTNGNFIFTDIGTGKYLNFTAQGDKLIDLTGAPRFVSGAFSIHSPVLESLKGCEDLITTHLNISICPKLKSLEYYPKMVKGSIHLYDLGITDLKGMTKYDSLTPVAGSTYILYKLNIKDLTGNTVKTIGTLEVRCCPNLASLKNGPSEVLSTRLSDCSKLSSIEGFPIKSDKLVQIWNCPLKENEIKDVCKTQIVVMN